LGYSKGSGLSSILKILLRANLLNDLEGENPSPGRSLGIKEVIESD